MRVRLIDHTDERTIAFAARVSNPSRQSRDEFKSLLRSCVKRNEWSVLESSCAILEVTTTVGVASQILRHRSFTFQQFSQRWQEEPLQSAVPQQIRAKGEAKHDSHYDPDLDCLFREHVYDHLIAGERLYRRMVDRGVHSECARQVLSMAQPTRLYITGNMRSWYHYIALRSGPETQAEHRDIALEALEVLRPAFPTVCELIDEKVNNE